MKRFVGLVLAFCAALGVSVNADAETRVRMSGDSRVYGVNFVGRNFTGGSPSAWTTTTPTWTRSAVRPEEPFEVWQRIRVRSDFIASRALKFRLAVKAEDTWGHGIYTAANPTPWVPAAIPGKRLSGIQVYEAYLQCKLPDSDVKVTAGLQQFDLPQGSIFQSSVVFGGDRAAALAVEAPLVPDVLDLNAGYARFLDNNQTFDAADSGSQADELDGYWLTLPLSLKGLDIVPWGLLAVAGRDADYYLNINTSFGFTSYAENLLSAGTLYSSGKWRNSQNLYSWFGGSFELTALEPARVEADVICGAGAQSDRRQYQRRGWFVDLAAEYAGWDLLTPQIFAWWSTGEDASWRNGSERLPVIRSSWSPGTSFLFDGNQEFGRDSNMGVNPVGAYGVGAALDNMTFVADLSHRLTFVFLHGNNAPRAIRSLNAYLGGGDVNAGSNPYFVMGRDLTSNECLYALNFDSKYAISDNMSAVVETGWAQGRFQESVWGSRLAHRASDAYKIAFGLTYKF